MNLSLIGFSQPGTAHLQNGGNTQHERISESNRSAFSVRAADVRAARRDRVELKMREREDALIQRLQDRITDVKNSDMDFGARNEIVKSIMEEIEAILEKRVEREIERQRIEMEERKAEFEEHRREREEKLRESAPRPENTEEALKREDMRNMLEISISKDSIRTFRQTRAGMEREASHLRQEIEGARPEHVNPNHFRNTHLEKLDRGIAGLSAAIDSEMGKINRTVRNWAENRNDIIQNSVNEPAEEKEPDINGSEQIQDLNKPEGIDLSV